MTQRLEQQLAALETLSPAQVRSEWRRVVRASPPQMTADLLARGIAWQLQAKVFGGLSKPAERALSQLASQAPGSPQPASLKPGTRLVRSWQGTTYDVVVTEVGFRFQEVEFRSLSSIAEKITGTRWSGPRFFGLTQRRKSVDA